VDVNKLNFAVIANLPAIMIEVEKSTHDEAETAIKGYDLLSKRDSDWAYKALTCGKFKFNEINSVRYKVMEHLIDLKSLFEHAFRFIHARADYYFGVLEDDPDPGKDNFKPGAEAA
jgi:hypothetical protein